MTATTSGLRELTREAGSLLVIDETHTLCCGPGGYTRAHGLEPDLLTIGKPIGGGIPVGAYGFTEHVAELISDATIWEAADVGGVGGTLAGNALSLAAVRATLAEVLTEEAFEHMIALGERFEAAVARDDRRASAAMVGDPAGLPGRVHVPGDRAANRGPRPRPRSTRSSTRSCTSTCSTAASC